MDWGAKLSEVLCFEHFIARLFRWKLPNNDKGTVSYSIYKYSIT